MTLPAAHHVGAAAEQLAQACCEDVCVLEDVGVDESTMSVVDDDHESILVRELTPARQIRCL